MKLTGSLRGGRHLIRNIGKVSVGSGTAAAVRKIWWKKPLKIVSIIAGVLFVLTAAVFAWYQFAVKPPDVNEVPRPSNSRHVNEADITPPPVGPSDDQVEPADETPGIIRDKNKFTFLLFANDAVGGNTDVIMVATFDATEYTLNVVNIPRDTMANVSWTSKKANAIHANWKAYFRGQDNAPEKAMEATLESFADILGFKVDFWIVVDMTAFTTLVNAIGGVDFYVPTNMEYHDPYQNLHISYTRGMKYGLTGQQALEIMRFRRYASGDIARIEVQQNFLKSAAEQILAKRNSINIMDLANTFINYVKTDLPLNNLVWFGKEFLKMEAEDISFVTAPGNYVDSVNGLSYVSLYVDQWLEIVNERLNPFSEEITDKDVSILTRGADRKLYVTDGNRLGNQSWGAASRGSGAGSSSGSSSSSSSSSSSGSSSSSSSSSGSGGNKGSSSANPSEEPSSSSPDETGNLPPDGVGDLPDIDPDATTLPTDEIPPLDIDPGQTENPADGHTQPDPAPPTGAPPEAPPPEPPVNEPSGTGD